MNTTFDQAETFEPVAHIKRATLLNGLVLALPLGIVTWFIVAFILNFLNVPAPLLLAIPPAIVFMVGIHWVRAKMLDREIAGTTFTLDSRGITQIDPPATSFVSWEDLRGARKVKPLVGMSLGKVRRSGGRSSTRGYDALASVASPPELGLVGLGTLTLDETANVMQRETYRQNETINGVDAQTGRPLVALYPLHFQARWTENRIGEWVKHFRPDVYAEAKAIEDQEAHIASQSLRDMWTEAKAKAEAERDAEADQAKTVNGHPKT